MVWWTCSFEKWPACIRFPCCYSKIVRYVVLSLLNIMYLLKKIPSWRKRSNSDGFWRSVAGMDQQNFSNGILYLECYRIWYEVIYKIIYRKRRWILVKGWKILKFAHLSMISRTALQFRSCWSSTIRNWSTWMVINLMIFRISFNMLDSTVRM